MSFDADEVNILNQIKMRSVAVEVNILKQNNNEI